MRDPLKSKGHKEFLNGLKLLTVRGDQGEGLLYHWYLSKTVTGQGEQWDNVPGVHLKLEEHREGEYDRIRGIVEDVILEDKRSAIIVEVRD